LAVNSDVRRVVESTASSCKKKKYFNVFSKWHCSTVNGYLVLKDVTSRCGWTIIGYFEKIKQGHFIFFFNPSSVFWTPSILQTKARIQKSVSFVLKSWMTKIKSEVWHHSRGIHSIPPPDGEGTKKKKKR
jgi:hypothetical protein